MATDVALDEEELVLIGDIGPGTTDAATISLSRGSSGQMRVEIDGDRCLLEGKAVWAFPLTLKNYVSILDTKNKEFCLIEDPEALDEESRQILYASLESYYRVYRIRTIRAYRNDWRTSFWIVETDHGLREFVMRWELDSVLQPSEHEVLIIDIDGNRFHIPDFRELDESSKRVFDLIL